MSQPTLPVPSFSRPRSISQSSTPDASQEHPAATLQEPLLTPSNVSDQAFQHRHLTVSSSVPQIHTPVQVNNNNKNHGRLSEASALLESTWFIEIFFLLCSAVCAVLIVAFLAVLNNTPVDDWHFYFSVNAIVSTLGVVFKSTLLMAVSAALAQGKWTWYRKRVGPLKTFQAIDAGSRDTLESFKLIWHMRGQHLVSMGALVMALGFMVDPFLQAIISDDGRLVDLDT
ncbi:hypothetical protein E4T49_06894 [Aureobasidium sp. EXF-10728]|nr:hypothetical protein E4T49_06894 [Aureobasidium sp. EXF-10728]